MLKIIKEEDSEEIARRLAKIFLAMTGSELILEAVNNVLWEGGVVNKLMKKIEEKTGEGLLILFNMLLTCTYYISNINSNKTTRGRWFYISHQLDLRTPYKYTEETRRR